MTECRYYEMCALRASIRNLPPSCDRRSCWMFRPMPDVDALLALADEIYDTSCDNHGELSVDLIDIWGWAQAISDALGVSE